MSDRLQQVLDELDSVPKLGEPRSPGAVTAPADPTFEHPLNERIRTFLRLEHLLGEVAHFLPQEDAWASRAVVAGILDILAITARLDIKTEILKELARNSSTLKRVRDEPEVDSTALGKLLDDLQQATSKLDQPSGQIGQALRQSGFLKDIIKRGNIPGGICSFELPQYHHWLKQPSDFRQRQLYAWMQDLQPVSNAVALILSLARTSATSREVTAVGGSFQETLSLQTPAQLVRITLQDADHLFPEISGYKNRFNIRFMSMQETGQTIPWHEDTTFSLTCCAF